MQAIGGEHERQKVGGELFPLLSPGNWYHLLWNPNVLSTKIEVFHHFGIIYKDNVANSATTNNASPPIANPEPPTTINDTNSHNQKKKKTHHLVRVALCDHQHSKLAI